jgi:hypothetical protein
MFRLQAIAPSGLVIFTATRRGDDGLKKQASRHFEQETPSSVRGGVGQLRPSQIGSIELGLQLQTRRRVPQP